MNKTVLILAIGFIAGLPASAATFNAYNEFSGNNPSGVWTYGSSINTDFTANFLQLPNFDPGNVVAGVQGWGSVASIARPNADINFGTTLFRLNFLTLHPGSTGAISVLRFTAPVAANYTFSGSFTDQDISGGSGVELFTRVDGSALSTNVQGANFINSPVPISGTVFMAAGARAYFAVGTGGNGFDYDSTGLRVIVSNDTPGPANGNVPEPSTFLLTSCGAALAFLLRRKRA